MKHASDNALDCLGSLLEDLRKLPSLKEKRRGIFYRKSIAFLHFHEDLEGLYADVRAGSEWERFPVATKSQQRALLSRVNSIMRSCHD